MVKIGKHEKKVEILEILASTEIIFDKTTRYARKNQQYWENIELRVAIPLLEKASQYAEYLVSKCREIYIETESTDYERGYALNDVKITPGALRVSDESVRLTEVYFEEIQSQILEHIRSAKYTIWVAVAWFTDNILMEALIEKVKQGINVQAIVYDDEINQPYFSQYEDKFEVIKAKPHGYYQNNKMHNKFCVIDLKTVIHGSFNWTIKAQYNKETISIESANRQFAEQFADEFIKLKKFYK